MGIMPDSSPFGSQTVTGPAWPNVDEEQLTAAAASYEKLAANISGNIVPEQTSQLMKLTEVWQGAGSLAASGEATTMIAGHEANAAQAQAIATQLTQMAAAVVQTKMAVNAAAQEVQHEVEALQALPFGNKQELIESRIKMGLSQNIATVTASTTSLASSLGTVANVPQMTTPPTAQAQQGMQQGMQQAMQMAGQLPQMLGQIPQMLGQIPQQLSQPLQQLSQPLQQLTSMLGSVGKGGGTGGGPSPFSAFSNHPLAGGSGPSSGAGMMKAASLPGTGGVGSQTPLMSKLVGGNTTPVSVDPAAAGSTAIGLAPVAAGGMGGMGAPMGMMGQRGASGGTSATLAVPAPLEHEVDVDDDDDDW
ncbi:hypothetical protein H7J87_32700 [Mycolicibacterium wolinskyi]|uniref:PPE family domain-containing protein n=1 Tax=Mycolicibacterium wolinskyi TaxID=59750 RepID=A0A1X2FI62_9MYCO|nr:MULTISPECIES: hypothetical protein [Mycolicibacterium]MCV7290096.1 hypothetical protein [Mycolicibacterium wolinskyi]MCV7292807.1 hypothetical protein [Mycolicibacterium goodii]ORX18112.1 hypothetical protein AWC31_17120 [Mycolicibacterium wolinskyi]